MSDERAPIQPTSNAPRTCTKCGDDMIDKRVHIWFVTSTGMVICDHCISHAGTKDEVQRLKTEMRLACVRANRAMREATAHLDNQHIYDLWQQAELIASACCERWLAANAQQQKEGEG